MRSSVGPLIGSVDQGTSSTRFIVFAAETGDVITKHQIEVSKFFPHIGWVEQDPLEILSTIEFCISQVNDKLCALDIDPGDIVGVGISSQRESVLAWDRTTGQPLYNSIVWFDSRTQDLVSTFLDQVPGRDIHFFKEKTGLPISSYFSAFKIQWLIQNVPTVTRALEEDRLMVGNMDAWILFNLIGEHATDVTNASRTFLMDIKTLQWDESLCNLFQIPTKILPKIKSSSEIFGKIQRGPLKDVPIAGVIGDQHAALVGLNDGQVKATFGTGCFLMQKLGSGKFEDVTDDLSAEAKKSLITTVAYKLGDEPACYALEGSVAIAGAAMTWLRDNIKLINDYSEMESLASQVPNSEGVFFVPAFQGLFAPHWDPTATGLIIGLSQYTQKSHIIRSTLEGIVYQTNDIVSLLSCGDAGIKVAGGLSSSNLLCQLLADITGNKILRPTMLESTALGAAIITGLAMSVWDIDMKNSQFDFKKAKISAAYKQSQFEQCSAIANLQFSTYDMISMHEDSFLPQIDEKMREAKISLWKIAVDRSRNWTKIESTKEDSNK